ncbi:MAG TPA: hypothetical protein DC058_19995 [Planctomycetaceae bacterium]|nr:hypothetical protein [Planctomycetaceae bacterium]
MRNRGRRGEILLEHPQSATHPPVLSSAIVSREDATPRRIDTVLRRISRDRQFKQPSAHPQLKTED